MRQGTTLRRTAVVGLIVGLALVPLRAYDDDTHYYFTYYLARVVGYTPLQSYRIASATVGIDYGFETAPEQYQRTLNPFTPPRAVQDRRIRFHAFQDADAYGSGTSDDGQAAIGRLQDELWARGVNTLNPGVFLHFFQDTFAHDPLLYQSIHGHVMHGHWPDFLSSDHVKAERVARETIAWLTRFMRECCKVQQPQDIDFDAAVRPVLNGLIEATASPPIGWQNLEDLVTSMQIAPDKPRVHRIVSDALATDLSWTDYCPTCPEGTSPGMAVPDLAGRFAYDFNEYGYVPRSQTDQFVLLGSALIDVVDHGGNPIQGATLGVRLEPDAIGRGGDVLPFSGGSVAGQLDVLDLPVGRYAFVVSHPDYASKRVDLLVDRPRLAVRVALTRRPAAETRPPVAPRPRTGGIRIQVTDDQTGAPIDGAEATLTSEGLPRQIFTMAAASEEQVPVGPYRVSVTAPLYAPAEQSGIEITVGGTAEVHLRLTPIPGTLAVEVVDDETGTPLLGVRVLVNGSRQQLTVVTPATVRAEPGIYAVSASRLVMAGVAYQPATMGGVQVASDRRSHVVVRLMRETARTPPVESGRPLRIELDPASLTLEIGDGEQIRARVLDGSGVPMADSVVLWSAGAAAVASVDANGYVRGVGPGTTAITASTGPVAASIPVVVRSNDVISSCEIVDAGLRLPARGAAHTFSARAIDTGGRTWRDVTWRWSSSDVTVALVDPASGRVTTERPGRFTLWAQGFVDGIDRVVCATDVEVENRWQDVLVSGRVIDAVGRPVSGASVSASGGPAGTSAADGRFTVRAGRAPHAEGAAVEAAARSAQGSGRARGVVTGGLVADLVIAVGTGDRAAEESAAALAEKDRLAAEERARRDRAALEQNLAGWRARLACLEEGKRKSPRLDLDCNGSFMIGTRDGHIENLRKLIADGERRLGLDVSAAPADDRAGAAASRPATSGAVPASSPRGGGDGSAGSVGSRVLRVRAPGSQAWQTAPGGARQPIAAGGTLVPGTSVQTGSGSPLELESPNGTRIILTENTEAVVGPSASAQPVIEIRHGAADVVHDGPPSFDDVIRTPQGDVRPEGTRYRLRVDATGTDVEVLDGVVRLTGQYIVRVYAGPDSPKPSPVRALVLRSGERARMLAAALPSWLPPETAPADLVSGRASGSSEVPSWATGTTSAPTVQFSRPDPWNDGDVRRLIDEWLTTAIPTAAATYGGTWRYTEWGTPIGPGMQVTGSQQHPSGIGRHEWLWANRAQFGSLNACMLEEFVARRLTGRGLDGCAQRPGPGTSSDRAVEDALARARREVAGRQAAAVPASAAGGAGTGAAPPPRSVERTAPAASDALNSVQGAWICQTLVRDESDGASERGSESVVISKTAGGYRIMFRTSGDTMDSRYVRGSHVGFLKTVEINGVRITGELDLERISSGQLRAGGRLVSSDGGVAATFTLQCTPEKR